MAEIFSNHSGNVFYNKSLGANLYKCPSKFQIKGIDFFIWVSESALAETLAWITAYEKLRSREMLNSSDVGADVVRFWMVRKINLARIVHDVVCHEHIKARTENSCV